jgi:hypothetical protein
LRDPCSFATGGDPERAAREVMNYRIAHRKSLA